MPARPPEDGSAAEAPAVRALCYLGSPEPGGIALPGPGDAPECAPAGFRGRPRVFVVDGGLDLLLAESDSGARLPQGFPRRWSWVGDGDSLASDDPVERAAGAGIALDVKRLPVEKDMSDFGAALDALEKELDGTRDLVVDVYGGLGGRRDHEICNLLEAAEFVARASARAHAAAGKDASPGADTCAGRIATTVVTFHGVLSVFTGTVEFRCAPGTIVSFAHLRGDARLQAEGVRYGGALVLRRGSHGLSNVVEGGLGRFSTDGVFTLVRSGTREAGSVPMR